MNDPPRSHSRYYLRNTQSDYIYTPLSTNPIDSIRLLRLHPSSYPSSPLRCTLFTTTLAISPSYVALSYAWGSPNNAKNVLTITDNSLPPLSNSTSSSPDSLLDSTSTSNSNLKITTSLHQALLRLRDEKDEVLLWVDAVCINQSDVAERNVQTGKMREIYVNAESVAVWLGLEYKGSREALEFVKGVVTLHRSHSKSQFESQTGDEYEEMQRLLKNSEESLRAVVRLFRRQYWWRIWVIQEVTCGRRSVVYCGDDKVKLDTLDSACEIFATHQGVLRSIFFQNQSFVRTLVAGGPKGLQLSRYSHNSRGHTALAPPPLLDLLISHKGKKSTEPRDKVFALLGVSDSRDFFGDIDYSASLRDVYTHTARHIIETTGRLDVICVKQNFASNDKNGFPSWVPDWRRLPTKQGSTLVGSHHCEPVLRACGGRSADFEILRREDGDVLLVKGVITDTITTVGVPFKKKLNPNDPVPPLRAVIEWWKLFSARIGDSQQAMARFGRILSCGTWTEADDVLVKKVEAIFALTEDLLGSEYIPDRDEEIVMDDFRPPALSRPSSSRAISRTTTMTSSSSLVDSDGDESDSITPEERERLSTILSASLMMNRRRLIISNRGLVGLGLCTAEAGDLICVLGGCRFPVVLRRREEGKGYSLVGESFVEGIMYGEGFGMGSEEEFEIH